MDYRKMYDSKLLRSFDLEDDQGRKFDRTLVIKGCTAGELTSAGNKKDKLPLVSFEGESKQLGINKTNGKVLAGLYGKDVRSWIGRSITVYATTTKFGSETVDCVRIRPTVPVAPQPGKKQPAAPESVELSAAAQDIAGRIESAKSSSELAALLEDVKAAVLTLPEREQSAIRSVAKNRSARLKADEVGP